MKTSKTPTGQRIVVEVVKEMQAGLYPLFYRTLAPSLYHIYLHADDYREIEAVTSLIVVDAQRALSGRVTRLNQRSRLSKLLSDGSPVEAPTGGWEIHIHADANGELERGELGIVSRLSVPAAPHYDGGTPTARIVRTVVTSTARRSVTSDETAPPPIPTAPEPVASAPHAGQVTETAKHAGTAVADVDGVQGFARLAYVDEQGPHIYAIKKDVISIGRGGREHWVDVQLVTSARVSREHCRIRRDDQGRFFLHDLSTWGTSIDGKPVKPPGAPSDGVQQQGGHEQELPAQARIQLADAVVIEFQVQPSS